MHTMRPLLAVGLFLLLAGVGGAQVRPQEAILGRWESNRKENDSDVKITLEFLRDGRTTMDLLVLKGGKEVSKQHEEGSYRWIDDETIEVTINKEADRAKVKATDRELTITPKSGPPLKFERISK
jgi:hypothetical protein